MPRKGPRFAPGRDLLCFVANALAAVIAVAGTLLGSSLTYLFQRRSADRQQVRVFSQQLRAERLAAYSGFVAALTEFMRGEVDWFNRRLEVAQSAATMTARVES